MPQMHSAGGGGSSFTYAGADQPADPREGETWYDTANQESKVYTGADWALQTLDSHDELGNVRSGQHHTRYSDEESRGATWPAVPMPTPETVQYTRHKVQDGSNYTHTPPADAWTDTGRNYSADFTDESMARITFSADNTMDSDDYTIGIRLRDDSTGNVVAEYSQSSHDSSNWTHTEYLDVRSWTGSKTFSVEVYRQYDHDNVVQQNMEFSFPKTPEGTQ